MGRRLEDKRRGGRYERIPKPTVPFLRYAGCWCALAALSHPHPTEATTPELSWLRTLPAWSRVKVPIYLYVIARRGKAKFSWMGVFINSRLLDRFGRSKPVICDASFWTEGESPKCQEVCPPHEENEALPVSYDSDPCGFQKAHSASREVLVARPLFAWLSWDYA